MNSERSDGKFSNREIIGMIRSRLDRLGHGDVMVSRLWIDEETPGFPFLLHVPVGAELTVPLRPHEDIADAQDAEQMGEHARQFADALVNLRKAEKTLANYARDVRRAAAAEIGAARAEGLDILLDRVGCKPTYASHLTCKDWNDAAHRILAAITVRHTSFHLRPTTSEHWVEEPEDVASELQLLIEEQRERQHLIAELDAAGTDLIVDGITLDILAAHDLDAEDALRRVWRKQCLNLPVTIDGMVSSLSLVTSEGRVTAVVELPGAVWNGEHLWFTGDERKVDHTGLVGKSLGDLVPHPAFTSRPIVAVTPRYIDHFSFDLSDRFRFDADTGRIWREERLAA